MPRWMVNDSVWFHLPVERSFSLRGVEMEQKPEPGLENTEPVILGNFAWNFHFVFGTQSGFFWGKASAIAWQSCTLYNLRVSLPLLFPKCGHRDRFEPRWLTPQVSVWRDLQYEKYTWCHWWNADFSFLLPSPSLIPLPLPHCLSNIFRVPALC